MDGVSGRDPDRRAVRSLDESYALGDMQRLADRVAMPGRLGAGVTGTSSLS